jgi:hypothetical protein
LKDQELLLKFLLAFNDSDLSRKKEFSIKAILTQIENWDFFIQTIRRHGMGGLIYKNICQTSAKELIPANVFSDLKSLYYRTLQRNALLYNCFSQIADEFLKHEIPCIPLKGIYLAESYYKDLGKRQMFDIDLFIKARHISACVSILHKLDFTEESGVKSSFIHEVSAAKHLPPMYKEGISVELHYQVWVGETTNQWPVEEIWKEAESCEINGKYVLTMSHEFLVIYLCLHVHRHLVEGNVQLFQWLDIVILIKKTSGDLKWQVVQQKCADNMCLTEVFSVLYILRKCYDIELPDSIKDNFLNSKFFKYEDLFLRHLFNREIANRELAKIQEIHNLKKISGIRNKLKFIIKDIFPSPSFLIKRYRIKNSIWIPAFYIYRFFYGVYLITRYAFVSLFSKK